MAFVNFTVEELFISIVKYDTIQAFLILPKSSHKSSRKTFLCGGFLFRFEIERKRYWTLDSFLLQNKNETPKPI